MATETINTDVTRRLDRLHWSRFHTLIVAVLGVGWLLDAFEVNIVGSVLGVIQNIFHLTDTEAAWVVSIWLIGIMVGAFSFGYLTDRFGRKRLFLATLLLYSICTILTAFSPNYAFLMLFRFLTAIGVGAEYTAINSAISELVPARNRGRINALVMNFWPVGAMLANCFATGAWTSAYPTFSEIFPTHLRSTGIGLSVAVGRIGAIASGPLLIWISHGSGGISAALVTMGALWLVGALAMLPWYFRGIEGAGTPLEQMVATAPVPANIE